VEKDGTNLNLDFFNILFTNYSKFSANIQSYFGKNLRYFETSLLCNPGKDLKALSSKIVFTGYCSEF
jgi:hypothetical protein